MNILNNNAWSLHDVDGNFDLQIIHKQCYHSSAYVHSLEPLMRKYQMVISVVWSDQKNMSIYTKYSLLMHWLMTKRMQQPSLRYFKT